MLEKMLNWIRQIMSRLLKESPDAAVSDIMLSAEMEHSLSLWAKMYTDNSPWLDKDTRSLGLPAVIA